MLTIDESMKIINNGKRKYTREEIRNIRDFLYILAKLQTESNLYIIDYNEEETSSDKYQNLSQFIC